MTPLPRRGLYAIADTSWVAPAHLLTAVSEAIAGGAVMIQLRDKAATVIDDEQRLLALLELCRRQRVPFIINDDSQLAIDIGADGVHIGQSDGDIAALRTTLGASAIIGVSCHDSLDSARRAVAEGADYVAFGRFFTSRTKPDAPGATLEQLRTARAELSVPIVAIGGITPDNSRELLAAGADLLAVIAGVFAQTDTRAAAAAYQRIIQQAS